MTKDELVTLVRVLADDNKLPYLVSNALLDVFIDEAEKEAAERALYFRLNNKFNISIVAGTATYQISDKIIFIERAKLSSSQSPVVKTTKNELDYNLKNWDLTQDKTKYFFQEDRNLTLYPIPDANDSLILDGFRRHCCEMETPEQWHHDLAYWCLYRIYSIPDVDIYLAEKAQLYLQMFSNAFGHKRQAWFDTIWRNTSANSPMYRNPFA